MEKRIAHTLATHNATRLAVLELPPLYYTQPRAVVQIIHGAMEYKERYLPLATYLQESGYAVVLSDNRGHGHSVSADDPFGLMKSVDQLVADQVQITNWIKEHYPQSEVVIYGHSMGSLIARLYLQRHDHLLSKLIMTGTPNYNVLAPLGMRLIKLVQRVKKDDEVSNLVARVCGNQINGYSWLSYNQDNIACVRQDPMMIKRYPLGSMKTLVEADLRLKDPAQWQCQQPHLPILNLVGVDDHQITGGKKGIADTVARLKQSGYHNIQTILMPHMKHEVLFEKDHRKVYQAMNKFLAE